MTAFRAHRRAIGWDLQHVARLCRVGETEARRWDDGKTAPPQAVSDWLAVLAEFHKAHPVPRINERQP